MNSQFILCCVCNKESNRELEDIQLFRNFSGHHFPCVRVGRSAQRAGMSRQHREMQAVDGGNKSALFASALGALCGGFGMSCEVVAQERTFLISPTLLQEERCFDNWPRYRQIGSLGEY